MSGRLISVYDLRQFSCHHGELAGGSRLSPCGFRSHKTSDFVCFEPMAPISGRGWALKGEDELTEPKYEGMVADRESCV